MTEWTKTFAELSRAPPKLYHNIEDGYSSEFWEKLYDAFRDRLLYEITEGVRAQTGHLESYGARIVLGSLA